MKDSEKHECGKKTAGALPVVETMPADLLTPLAVYLKMSKGSRFSFLLESVEGGENLARYSFIGADPEFVVSGTDRYTTISSTTETRNQNCSLLDFLKDHFEKRHLAGDGSLPLLTGGAIGYFGFRCCEWFEPSLSGTRPSNQQADAEFMIYHSVVAFDHAKQTINIVTLVFTDEATDEIHLKSLEQEATNNNFRIRELLESGEAFVPRTNSPAHSNEPQSNFSQKDFEASVEKIKELIHAGECYQVVLSQRFSKSTTANAVGIYRAIRSINPSPYMFLLQFGERSIVGASPEMLVRCTGPVLEYRPIAGTRPRGKTSFEDDGLSKEMRADSKEVAEHLMLVDLGRNDLGRVAEFGSVNIEELMEVEKYSHVQHLVSRIKARLRANATRFDVLAACFPAGTVSGAPKVRAIEIIKELEPTARGVYSGAVGYFAYSGNMDMCIAIRTLVLENGVATVQAGAGIVADSIPELEYKETVAKAMAMLRAIETAEGK